VYLGAHIGIAGGLAEAPAVGRGIGCEAIQIFSKSPQMWAGPAFSPEAVEGFRVAVRREDLKATAVHHGYLANLASPKAVGLKRSRTALLDELGRAQGQQSASTAQQNQIQFAQQQQQNQLRGLQGIASLYGVDTGLLASGLGDVGRLLGTRAGISSNGLSLAGPISDLGMATLGMF